MKEFRVNERIRISQIRVIGENGEQLGVMAPADALRRAREVGLDLVEVAPGVTPPVCRILNFNKFKYQEARREREARRKHHVTKLKEVKFKPRIEAHDYQVKLDRIKKFLLRGDQTKVTMVYRGREMAHTELGRKVLDRLTEDVKAIAKVERSPMLDGRFMTMVFAPDRDAIQRAARQAKRRASSSTGGVLPSAGPSAPAPIGSAPSANPTTGGSPHA